MGCVDLFLSVYSCIAEHVRGGSSVRVGELAYTSVQTAKKTTFPPEQTQYAQSECMPDRNARIQKLLREKIPYSFKCLNYDIIEQLFIS